MTARALGDLIRFSTTPLSAEQRRGLAGLLDEIGVGIAMVARVRKDQPESPGVHRATEAGCWEAVAEEYTRLLDKWGLS